MKFCESENLVGALAAELTVEAMENRGFLRTADKNTVVCAGDDWQQFSAPLWISDKFIGVAKVNRSVEDALFGRVKIFRVNDLVWRNEHPDFDEHRAAAHVEFLLPERFQRTGEGLVVHSHGAVDDELTRSVLYDFVVQTRAHTQLP